MNLFRREIKKNFKSFLFWTIALVGINALMLATFESVAQQAEAIKSSYAGYPEAFIKAFNLDTLEMTDILHFFASRSYLVITVIGSIYVIILAATILSKEESDRTIEFLMSKPITRKSIVTSKILCTTFYVTMLNLVFSVSNFILMSLLKVQDFDMAGFLLISIGPWFIHIIFAAIGLALSVYITKSKTILSLSIGIVFIEYFFSILPSMEDSLTFFQYLTPFSYYGTSDLIVNTEIQGVYLLLTFLIVVIATIATYAMFFIKDIEA